MLNKRQHLRIFYALDFFNSKTQLLIKKQCYCSHCCDYWILSEEDCIKKSTQNFIEFL